ncbi:alcohol dehydrogenase catalytic domain-containing protein, partial [Paracoccus sp. APAP_BH8]|uniref:alcohol dehydrogenase catalytic domain-containing protein n=1 Tax=Paracoccus sp. APAP_BH8 TaxID=3110237 RepID=UPI002FD7F03B
MLGNECGGVVVGVGVGVTKVAPGDRVAVQPLIMPRHIRDQPLHGPVHHSAVIYSACHGVLRRVGLSLLAGPADDGALGPSRPGSRDRQRVA